LEGVGTCIVDHVCSMARVTGSTTEAETHAVMDVDEVRSGEQPASVFKKIRQPILGHQYRTVKKVGAKKKGWKGVMSAELWNDSKDQDARFKHYLLATEYGASAKQRYLTLVHNEVSIDGSA